MNHEQVILQTSLMKSTLRLPLTHGLNTNCYVTTQDHIKAAARAVLNDIILEIEAEESSANSDEDAAVYFGPCDDAPAAGLATGAAVFAPSPTNLQACHHDTGPFVLTLLPHIPVSKTDRASSSTSEKETQCLSRH
jgi:hypothetical protein